ncbi:MAG: RNase adapter RapZ [Rhodobacteraceae bacterium]|nr:RNase adapter RapZ [Paracoccaceae bacterium]
MEQNQHKQEIVIVTGPAGAGRTTAIKAIEDFGVETIDNLPLNLINRILFGPPTGDTLAIGIDTRTRGFSTDALLEIIDSIGEHPNYKPTLLYLDCRKETLLRRFSETRRRHPSSPDGTPAMGIKQEVETLNPLRDRADILIDTSELSPHQLRAELARWFDKSEGRGLSISVQSFSYKRGTPRGVDMMIDCRFLRNPHWEPALRQLTGLAPQVGEYVTEDPLFDAFFEKLQDFVELLLPAYQAEGKAYFSIGMGCTGGQHRSVFVAEKLAKALSTKGWMVNTRHKEMERWPKGGAQK